MDRDQNTAVKAGTVRVEALKAVCSPSFFELWRDKWRACPARILRNGIFRTIQFRNSFSGALPAVAEQSWCREIQHGRKLRLFRLRIHHVAETDVDLHVDSRRAQCAREPNPDPLAAKKARGNLKSQEIP